MEHFRGFRTNQTGDSADVAFASGSEEISTQLVELEVRELNQIERALTRLRQSTYGLCEVCRRKIPVARLNALLCSTACITCQRALESSPGRESRRPGRDWETICDAAPAPEEQRHLDPTRIERDLLRHR
jgi:DnaK suppressor protein